MDIWLLGAFWFLLALIADFISIRFKLAVALSEILVGVVIAFLISLWLPEYANFGSDVPWVSFLAGVGAVLLTFLAGTELDPAGLKGQFGSVMLIGLVGFFVPFIGCTAAAYYLLGWSLLASLLVGVALSTSSVAIVYAVMLELGLNRTRFGKAVLAACFVNDVGTVLALGFIFSPFTWKSAVFIGAAALVFVILPKMTRFTFDRWGNRHSEQEVKFLLFFLFGLGFLAFWSGSEPVLPAYIMGMLVASILEKKSHAGEAPPRHYVWPSDTFLFLARRRLCFDSRTDCNTSCFHHSFCRENDHESHRCISRCEVREIPAQRCSLYDTIAVDRPHLWHHLRSLWPHA